MDFNEFPKSLKKVLKEYAIILQGIVSASFRILHNAGIMFAYKGKENRKGVIIPKLNQ